MKTERELFKQAYLNLRQGDNLPFPDAVFDEYLKLRTEKGYKLVPVNKINEFYQDDDEPENFCEKESDLDILADGVDIGGVLKINKFTQVELSKDSFYGAWCACEPVAPYFEKRKFKLFDTYSEANKAMIGAVE